MAKVTVYGKLIRGSDHVSFATAGDGPCALFVPRLEVNGTRILTEHPEEKAWREAGRPADKLPRHYSQPEMEIGEGFMTLNIEHADDQTWEFLQTLSDDHYTEGATRAKFGVLVTEFEYIALEPGDPDPIVVPELARG
jgi:hypothetical protein